MEKKSANSVGLMEEISSGPLKLISGQPTFVLDASDGEKVIANAKNIFSYIDSGFKNDEKIGPTTGKTPVQLSEMVEDTSLRKMFDSLSSDLNNFCFSQSQIINFVEKYPKWLQAGGPYTFFLYKSRGRLFVAAIYSSRLGNGLEAHRYEFDNCHIFHAKQRHRVVVPKLG